MSSGGDWIPLYISLAILFISGGFIPAVISSFLSVGQYNQDSFAVPIIGFIENGFQLPILSWIPFLQNYATINPFSWFGSGFQAFLVSQFSAFTFIPNYISIPLLFIMAFGFLYTILKMIPIIG
jgi:hypothetical protein